MAWNKSWALSQWNSQYSDGIDIWRETPLRLLGYANEVGESFRYVFPIGVRPSYAIAFAYVLADTQHKFVRQYRRDGQ